MLKSTNKEPHDPMLLTHTPTLTPEKMLEGISDFGWTVLIVETYKLSLE